ncbi:MAG: hypothetical protein Q8922_03730 [Bacteroidota bacterium]|nr:hypothetical protein [Bacteroidota bacterium]MDP4233403.1 hypothetical protein [Bacteroidota bacterium]MDP4242269.1 hypothetical protein [Bacteroidota bacterium]MDP4287025.1 hypothetical protein [Bacteroidota bacterium]
MKSLLVLSLALCASSCVVNFKSEKTATNIIHVDIRCSYPGKSELNTYEGYYKKEIAPGHYAQTNITLDPGQQLLILNKALVLHFYQMPAKFTHTSETDTLHHSLRIQADTLDHTITWQGSIQGLHPNTYHPEQLFEYIDSIVRSTEEYQALPKVAGEK